MAFNIEDIIEEQKRREEYYRNYAKAHPEQYDHSLEEWVKSRQARGEIVNPILKNWLENEIASARVVLIVGMILTALIKGQIVIWVILYIAYRGRVKRAREEAIKEDRKRARNE